MARSVFMFVILLSFTCPAQAESVVIALGGDVALNWRGTPRNWTRFPWEKNPFRRIASIFKKADFSVANMEGVLMRRDPKYAIPKYNLWAPAVSAQVFKPAGIDLVSHANNHTFDGRDKGVLETLRHLHTAGVKTFGSGPTQAAATAPFIWRKGATCIAFLPATTKMNKWIGGKAHVAMYKWNKAADKAALVAKIKAARSQCPTVLVYIHWGRQYRPAPEPWMRTWAHRMVDAGAQAVVGHHSHVLGAVEHYKGALIAYSLGNLVFSNPNVRMRRTGVLFLKFEGNTRVKSWLEPVFIERKGYVPRPMTRTETHALANELSRHSKPLKTHTQVEGGVIKLNPAP